jgi:hypothetical protein
LSSGPVGARPSADYFFYGANNHEYKQNSTHTPDTRSAARYQQLWKKRRTESTRQCRTATANGIGDYGCARAGHEYQ